MALGQMVRNSRTHAGILYAATIAMLCYDDFSASDLVGRYGGATARVKARLESAPVSHRAGSGAFLSSKMRVRGVKSTLT